MWVLQEHAIFGLWAEELFIWLGFWQCFLRTWWFYNQFRCKEHVIFRFADWRIDYFQMVHALQKILVFQNMMILQSVLVKSMLYSSLWVEKLIVVWWFLHIKNWVFFKTCWYHNKFDCGFCKEHAIFWFIERANILIAL